MDIIDLFEMVQVDQRHRERQAVALPGGHRRLQFLLHGPAVLDAGQRVDHRQLLEPGSLALVAQGENIGAGADHDGGGDKGKHVFGGLEGGAEDHQHRQGGTIDNDRQPRRSQEETGDQGRIQPEQAGIAQHRGHRHAATAGNQRQHQAAAASIAGDPGVHHGRADAQQDQGVHYAGQNVAINEPEHRKRGDAGESTDPEQGDDGKPEIMSEAIEHRPISSSANGSMSNGESSRSIAPGCRQDSPGRHKAKYFLQLFALIRGVAPAP